MHYERIQEIFFTQALLCQYRGVNCKKNYFVSYSIKEKKDLQNFQLNFFAIKDEIL